MLRLKGERDDDTLREDEVRPRLVDIEETDELTGKDVFPGDESNEDTGYLEYDSGRPGRSIPFRGFAIATAAFAPTFLLIFFGLPYLVGSAVPARPPSASVASPAPEIDPKAFPSPSEAARGDLRSGLDSRSGLGDARGGLGGRMTTDPFRSTPPVSDEPKAEPSRVESPKVDTKVDTKVESPKVDTKVESPKVDTKVEERAAAVAPEPVPSLPPSLPRRTAPTAPPIAPQPRVPEASRSAATVPPPSAEPRAAVEPRRAAREPRDWTPAAAFTDRAAASRLASSIERQGYPVEIRQDASSSRPWVVWIGAQPSGGSRRR